MDLPHFLNGLAPNIDWTCSKYQSRTMFTMLAECIVSSRLIQDGVIQEIGGRVGSLLL